MLGRAADNKGVDIIIDFIGPQTFAADLRAAARDAHIVNLATCEFLYLSVNHENSEHVLICVSVWSSIWYEAYGGSRFRLRLGSFDI